MSDYSEVLLAKLNPEAKLPTDVYIFINKKYVKYKNKGDIIGKEKYDLFISKNVKSLYVESDHILKFLEWLNDVKAEDIQTMVSKAGEENRALVESTIDLEEVVYDVFSDEELNSENVKKIQTHVSTFVEHIKENPITSQAIQAIMQRSDDIAAHSVNVANLAIFLGMAIGHGHSFVLENLYMGAIFHDYGKAKIPPEIYDNPNHPDYEKWINKHPENSVKIISKSEGIPDQVYNIILHHHEYYDGSGYPKGIAGRHIYSLSQIVSMANEVDNYLTENKKFDDNLRYEQALNLLEEGAGKKWAPDFFPRVTDAFKLGFLDS